MKYENMTHKSQQGLLGHKTPIKKFRSGGVVISLWENTHLNNAGEFRVLTAEITRTYKAKDGSFKKTNNFNLSGVQKLRALLRHAEDFMLGIPEGDSHVESSDE